VVKGANAEVSLENLNAPLTKMNGFAPLRGERRFATSE
jgi:hypothetical protein